MKLYSIIYISLRIATQWHAVLAHGYDAPSIRLHVIRWLA